MATTDRAPHGPGASPRPAHDAPTRAPAPWDELYEDSGTPRPAARRLAEHLSRTGLAELQARQQRAVLDIMATGVTFTVYSDGRGIDRAWPLDIIPRVIAAREWAHLRLGLIQRVTALNRFLNDVYNEQRVIADGVIPRELVEGSAHFQPACRGARPRFGVWAHVCGSDLVRDVDGTMYILEDNLRVPSGVSYMLENRAVSKRAFGELFARQSIHPIDDYPERLLAMLGSLAPDDRPHPRIVVLTPGVYNSAYFEHAFLARRMGVPLVEGGDLMVDEHDRVLMRTIDGREPVDVIYRRVDDEFLDPEVFRADSLLGVPGLMRAWRAGRVGLANAPGTGVADDKLIYAWVPEFIRYYLDEEPIIPSVPVWRCVDPDERAHVLDNLEELVVKPTNESGGYGLVIGPHASADDLRRARAQITDDPRSWIGQPIITLSTSPTLCGDSISARHVDCRPFVLSGDSHYVTNGGLSRVALREGSLVVNSSQGGGSKDTWVIEHSGRP